LRPSRAFINWHFFHMGLLLLFLMCDNWFYRILNNRFLIFIPCCHRRTNNSVVTIVSCTVDEVAIGIEKNGSRTIGVGTCTRFSLRLISRATMLPLNISSSKKIACLISTNFVCLLG
jgi:hypothetical protein